jgi:Xaa-Pro aminopeptidase
MKIIISLLYGLCLTVTLAVAAERLATQLPGQLYQERCRQVLGCMDSSSVLVLRSADSRPRSMDVNYPYRQDSNFYYLTGIDQSGAFLVLVPAGVEAGGVKRQALLFADMRSGSVFNKKESPAQASLGADTLFSSRQFDALFNAAIKGKKTLYYSMPQPTFVNDPVANKRFFLDRDVRKELANRYSGLQIKPVNDLIAPLRRIKSPEELKLIQKAIDITTAGLVEAYKSAMPGMYEYELQALLEYAYTRNGANGPGFPCIIGSGPNSLVLHYDDNNRLMQAGDVVVLDVGGEYGGYTADITRTMPVSGRFTEAQKELYNVVLQTQKETLSIMKPGATFRAIDEKALDATAQGLLKLGLIKDKEEVRRFLPHGVSHHIGLDVHDVGQTDTLRVNMVVTLEPGVYVPANDPTIPEKYRNIGIRIEDDVWIVEGGHKVLTDAAPKEISEIEKLMKKKGLGNMTIGR